jgi:hypothetical protein
MSVTILTKSTEVATVKVLDWLMHLNVKFNNISTLDFMYDKISISFSTLEKPKINYNDTDISATNKWTRKYVRTKVPNYPIEFQDFVFDELKSFHISLISSLNISGRLLGSNNQYIDPMNVNKVHVLLKARELGIKIPNTLISNDESKINSFIASNDKSIIKPLSEPFIFLKENK